MAFSDVICPLNAFNVIPSDSAIISGFGFLAPTGGTVVVMPSYQEGRKTPMPVTFTGLVAGHDVIWLKISRVMATGTTVTGLVVFGPT